MRSGFYNVNRTPYMFSRYVAPKEPDSFHFVDKSIVLPRHLRFEHLASLQLTQRALSAWRTAGKNGSRHTYRHTQSDQL